ncbi:hypothetical protein PR048_016368 [Dryococelus australis]|uniref:Uncharacterized protein n=1 Tax=Dryococelus australis TaxID=614101 RepID=A0ABQ9HK32_9NEOP|nr:hypothetical protein PR048_016368 [Dryococelus australis]
MRDCGILKIATAMSTQTYLRKYRLVPNVSRPFICKEGTHRCSSEIARIFASRQSERGSIPGGVTRISACGERCGRSRWPASCLGVLPFPPPSHSTAALPSPHFTLTFLLYAIRGCNADVITPNHWLMDALEDARSGSNRLYSFYENNASLSSDRLVQRPGLLTDLWVSTTIPCTSRFHSERLSFSRMPYSPFTGAPPLRDIPTIESRSLGQCIRRAGDHCWRGTHAPSVNLNVASPMHLPIIVLKVNHIAKRFVSSPGFSRRWRGT